MKKQHKKIIRKVIEFSIYIFVAYFIYQKLEGNIDQVSFKDVDLKLLIVSIVIFSFHSIWNAFTWNYLIRSSGHETKTQQQMSVYLRSYIMRYIPGNVVGIFARGALNQPHGVPMFKSIWGWFLENLIYLGVGILLGLFAVQYLNINTFLFYSLFLITLILGAVIVFKNDLLEDLFEKYLLPRLPDKYQKSFKPLSLSLYSRINISFRFLVSWFIYSLSFIFVVISVGVNPSGSILTYVAINAIAYSVGYLTLVTPSGIGVREGVMIYLLGSVVGLDPDTSVIIAVLARIVFILGELLAFGIFYILSFIKNLYGKRV